LRAIQPTGAWLELGNLLAGQHKFDESIAPYRQAMAANPADPDLHRAIAAALHRCGRLDDAIFHWRPIERFAAGDGAGARICTVAPSSRRPGSTERRQT
jgi:Flp pilus assembly protein TadD